MAGLGGDALGLATAVIAVFAPLSNLTIDAAAFRLRKEQPTLGRGLVGIWRGRLPARRR